ncbi:MAG TPA: hypothetical protein VN915_11890 [Elusimicrobiota bacterium]|nr:hypothetical protein [Elusimicrobiota bacterium]
MDHPIFAASLLLAAIASLSAPVSSAAVPAAPPVPEAPFQVGPPAVHAVQAASRFEPDCKDVVFQPEDPAVSKPLTLTSVEWVTDCVPQGPSGSDSCFERQGRSDSREVRVTLAGRPKLNPWESDVFRACLTGTELSVAPVATAYEYTSTDGGETDGNAVFVAGAKRLLPPDPRGIQAVLTPGLTLAFYDLWADYYPGEEVELKMTLMRAHSFWPDETVVEKDVALPVARNYTVELSAAVHQPGEVYYARYSIRRLGGRVSTIAETPQLQTEKVSYDRDAEGVAP